MSNVSAADLFNIFNIEGLTPDQKYNLALVVLVILGGVLWIATWKADDPPWAVLTKLIQYFFEEKNGTLAQRVNFGLIFILGLVVLVTLAYSLLMYFTGTGALKFLFISLGLLLGTFVLLIICDNYTRAAAPLDI